MGLTKDNPERLKRDLEIVDLRMQGKSYREISQEKDISIGHVSNILSDDKLKGILKQTMRIYAAHAKGLGRKLLKLAYDEDKGISLKAIKEINKIIGVSPTFTQNFFIEQLNMQQNIYLDPEANQFLDDMLAFKGLVDDNQPVDTEKVS